MLDASVAVAWCFRDETTPLTERILTRLSSGAQAIVPAMWPFELTNALLTAERRKRITAAQSAAFLHRIRAFAISIEAAHLGLALDHVTSIARQQHLATYDAAYLELALRRSLPLATLDQKLRRAAQTSGIALLA